MSETLREALDGIDDYITETRLEAELLARLRLVRSIGQLDLDDQYAIEEALERAGLPGVLRRFAEARAALATPPVPAGDERHHPYRIARTRREEVILSWAGGEVTTEARDRLLASLDTPGACPSCDGTGFQSDAAGVRLTEGGGGNQ